MVESGTDIKQKHIINVEFGTEHFDTDYAAVVGLSGRAETIKQKHLCGATHCRKVNQKLQFYWLE